MSLSRPSSPPPGAQPREGMEAPERFGGCPAMARQAQVGLILEPGVQTAAWVRPPRQKVQGPSPTPPHNSSHSSL